MHEILVIDDIPDNVKLLTYALQDAGYDVLSATNGREGLRIIHEDGPRIVLTDWMMPEMDGAELCRAIRKSELSGYTYIIMLTAFTDRLRLVDAFEAGADDFLSKPFDPLELVARVKAGVRVVELEAELAAKRIAAHKANAKLAVLNEKLEVLATTDELTGLGNRREALRYLKESWNAARRRNKQDSLSVLMIDIDHFKNVNDEYGHEFGDVVLRETSGVLDREVRTTERCFRVGGEEFLVVLPMTDAPRAYQLAERLREAVAVNRIDHNGKKTAVSISVGLAHAATHITSPDHLMREADHALYAAKRDGRNRVCVAEPQPLVATGIDEI